MQSGRGWDADVKRVAFVLFVFVQSCGYRMDSFKVWKCRSNLKNRFSISGHNFSMNLIVVALDQLKIAKSRISRIVERKGKWKRRRGDMLHRSTCNSVRE